MRKTPTISMVAARARVAPSTVSRVLNGGYASPEVTERVERVIADLGYSPSPAARNLKTGRKGCIGVVAWSAAGPWFTQLLAGIEQELIDKRVSVMLSSLSRDGRYDSSAIAAWINEHRVDGIIFTSFGRTERPLVKGAAKAGLPVVFVAPDDLARVGVTVRSNNTDAGRAAGDHLADLGHQRIAFIGGPASSRDTRDRLAGVEHALRARSLRLDRDDVRFAKSYAAESGADEARALLASPKPWPTAIVVGNDALALGFMRVLLQNGVRIPADISVVGFDGIPEGARFWPALTTVAQPIVDMGAAACRTILERIDDPEIAGVSTVELPMTLEIRESTGPTAKYEQPTRISN